jgi:HEAT repeat protein
MTIREQTGYELALKELADYRAGKLDASHYDSLIVGWGKVGLLEARRDIEPFLYSPEYSLRSSALHTLAGNFHLQDYWPIAVQFLLFDPDMIVRREAAFVLGWLKSDTRDQRTLAVLADVVRDPYDDETVRKYAYEAMRWVAFGDSDVLGTAFYLERDADWDFVNAHVDPALEEERKIEARQVLEQYYAGKVAEQDHYAMLLKFGRTKLQEARTVVESFLKSETLLLQTTALHVLVLYLQVPDNWQLAVNALQHGPWSTHHDAREHDPESTYRQEAAFALGLLMRGTRDKATLHILDAFFDDGYMGIEVMQASENIYFGDHHPEHNTVPSYNEITAYLTSPDD